MQDVGFDVLVPRMRERRVLAPEVEERLCGRVRNRLSRKSRSDHDSPHYAGGLGRDGVD